MDGSAHEQIFAVLNKARAKRRAWCSGAQSSIILNFCVVCCDEIPEGLIGKRGYTAGKWRKMEKKLILAISKSPELYNAVLRVYQDLGRKALSCFPTKWGYQACLNNAVEISDLRIQVLYYRNILISPLRGTQLYHWGYFMHL